MTWKGRTGYVLAWIAAGAAVWFYVDRRNVTERFRAYQENEQAVRKAAEEAAALDEEVTATRERVQNLHSNPLEIESAIRRSKGLVRPGEIVYRIEEGKNASASMEPENGPAGAEVGAPDAPDAGAEQ